MKKILQKCSLAIALFLAINTQAQTVRYLDEVFSNVTVDSGIVYGANRSYLTGFAAVDSLRMDVYRPVGDTRTDRPVIILMHAGSYLPGSLTGFDFADRKEKCLVELCTRYAKRGYVAVSMSYRLGWNPSSTDADVRAGTIINAVYRSQQDAKTCVRYFRTDQANGNQWGIDPTKVVLGGTNSGAYTALAAGNLNNPTELVGAKFLDINGNSYIDTTKTGNFDGFGGTQNVDNYPGISSDFNAVLSLGGAVGDTSWIEPGEPAVIAFHGVSEPLTKYNTAVVVTSNGSSVIEVSGSGDFMPIVSALGNNSGFTPNNFPAGPPNKDGAGTITTPIDGLYPFYGQGFEPWNWYGTNPVFNPGANQTKAMLYIDTIIGYATPRLYKLLIGDPIANAGADQTVCSGTTNTLSSTTSRGLSPYTYQWTGTGDALSCSTCASPTVTSTQSSTYTVIVTDANLFSDTDEVSFAVTPSSITSQPSDASTTVGNNAQFVVASSGSGSTYQWQVNTGSGYTDVANSATYAGATDDTLVITGASAGLGGYLYRCVVSSGSCADTSTGAVLQITLGLGELTNNKISIYPNPGKNSIHFNLSNGIATSVSIYDVQGAFVKQLNPSGSNGQIKLDISDLNSGMYFLNVNADKLYRGKFVKE